MRAPISIVMPVLNAQEGLRHSIPALSEGLEVGLIAELIMSDGGSSDYTEAVADAAGAVWVTGAPGRGGQIARGVAKARAPWILILHADTALQPGWAEAVGAALLDRKTAHFGHLQFDTPGPAAGFVAGWANWRARWLGLPYGDQGLLIHQSLLEEVGGIPDLPLMEDVALARALRGRLRPLGAVARTSAARYEREGWLRRGARNLSLLLRYLGGADPARLAAAYRAPQGQD